MRKIKVMTAPDAPRSNPSPALLTSRTVLRICGGDARKWLNNLVTSNIETLAPQEARFAALLTPQGKIIADFFIVPDGACLLLDCASAVAETLMKRLAMYRLRADVQISDVSAQLAVCVFFDAPPPAASQGVVFADPRDAELGWRMIAPPGEIDAFGASAEAEAKWHTHRIALGVGEGGTDFTYGETFPHEANMDQLHGVDFRKGCYIGQEVVSRVEHRGTARKRIARIVFDAPAPARGTEILAGGVVIGATGSRDGVQALAMLRIDKAQEAAQAGQGLTADGISLRLA